MKIDREAFRVGMSRAHRLFQDGDFDGAVRGYLALLESGYAHAAIGLGTIYEAGCEGKERDVSEAEKWYQRAVKETGDFHAYMGLVRLYLHPKSKIFDTSKALSLLKVMEKHIEKKSRKEPGVYYGLGMVYLLGNGVEIDEDMAAQYLRIASKQGHLLAREHLARIGVKKGNILDRFRHVRAVQAIERQKRIDRMHPSVQLNPWSC